MFDPVFYEYIISFPKNRGVPPLVQHINNPPDNPYRPVTPKRGQTRSLKTPPPPPSHGAPPPPPGTPGVSGKPVNWQPVVVLPKLELGRARPAEGDPQIPQTDGALSRDPSAMDTSVPLSRNQSFMDTTSARGSDKSFGSNSRNSPSPPNSVMSRNPSFQSVDSDYSQAQSSGDESMFSRASDRSPTYADVAARSSPKIERKGPIKEESKPPGRRDIEPVVKPEVKPVVKQEAQPAVKQEIKKELPPGPGNLPGYQREKRPAGSIVSHTRKKYLPSPVKKGIKRETKPEPLVPKVEIKPEPIKRSDSDISMKTEASTCAARSAASRCPTCNETIGSSCPTCVPQGYSPSQYLSDTSSTSTYRVKPDNYSLSSSDGSGSTVRLRGLPDLPKMDPLELLRSRNRYLDELEQRMEQSKTTPLYEEVRAHPVKWEYDGPDVPSFPPVDDNTPPSFLSPNPANNVTPDWGHPDPIGVGQFPGRGVFNSRPIEPIVPPDTARFVQYTNPEVIQQREQNFPDQFFADRRQGSIISEATIPPPIPSRSARHPQPQVQMTLGNFPFRQPVLQVPEVLHVPEVKEGKLNFLGRAIQRELIKQETKRQLKLEREEARRNS